MDNEQQRTDNDAQQRDDVTQQQRGTDTRRDDTGTDRRGTRDDRHDRNDTDSDRTFTQAELDRIVSERVNRAVSKFGDYDDVRSRLKDYEDREKTEEQRREEAVQEMRRQLEAERSRALQYRAAAEHNITGDDTALIGANGTEDEVMARAKRIGELLNAERELRALRDRDAYRGGPLGNTGHGGHGQQLQSGNRETPIGAGTTKKDEFMELLKSQGFDPSQLG